MKNFYFYKKYNIIMVSDEEQSKKEALEREMNRKIDRLIMLGVIVLLIVVILIGILIRGSSTI
jgi:hypothetical protein